MTIVTVVCVGLFMIASLVVGVRLLFLFAKTRELPELLLAIALLGVGFLGFAVGSAAKLWPDPPASLLSWLPIVGLSLEYAGCLALMAFAWRVFHPRSPVAAAVAIALTAMMVAAILGETISGENLRYIDGGPISAPYVPLGLSARALGPAWMAFECLRYYAALRRRLRLGLADPLIAHRFLLWGLAIGAAAGGYAVAVAHRLIHSTGILAHAWSLGAVAFLAFTSAGALALAFFPPRAYRRWVRRGSRKPRDSVPGS
jgi:hypothetical protein